ncbi:drug/metabolite transporter (DMT)-like permease [Peptoniphilus koenoeneniae]|uniref:Drug/metabolite transporter (DMT)-like permease n=1 Tax=Peptoniphilus koenoeneniae TaxID=507751 RepID=A0ABU0AWT7_9FIRM|nr:DMT family transporter [Peptoniphilus koenoeneniae]MDQ0275490.1 drug/metabolite transporter (DMT)-like permease [Peptoniphilus koenoeneniae]
MKKEIRAALMLLLVALIWGTAFVFQSTAMDHVGPFTYNMARGLLAGFSLIIIILIRPKKLIDRSHYIDKKFSVKAGVILGILLSFAQNLQQAGMVFTDAGKSGFLTTLYIAFLPIFYFLMGKKPDKKVVICVILAIIGLYFISIKKDFTIERGDFLILLSAVGFALHIIFIDTYSSKCDGIILSCSQFFVFGIISGIIAFFIEDINMSEILAAKTSIFYTGILSSGLAYTLSIIALRDIDATIGSLILSLESIIAALAAAILLKESMTAREMLGCLIVFIATILAQIPSEILIKPFNKKIRQ